MRNWPVFPEQLRATLAALAKTRPPEMGSLSLPEARACEAGWLAALAAVATACGLEKTIEYKVVEGRREPSG